MISLRDLSVPVVLVLAACLSAQPAAAQSFDTLGPRARGMGGAFVAVADDATATWWNPAGLPGSLIFDGVATWGAGELIPRPDVPIEEGSTGRREETLGVTFVLPAVGVSYYRVRLTEAGPFATAPTEPGRQDERIAPAARSLLSHHLGLTLVQSLGDAVVVGATATLLGGEVSALLPAAGLPEGVLDRVSEASGQTSWRGDVGAGVLVRMGRFRAGLAGRNLTAPRFDGPEGADWRLERQARVGLAFVDDGERAGRQRWVIALDADLTRERRPSGDRRVVAFGGERWWLDRRLGLRGGLSASTTGRARTAVSGGASVGVAGGVWLEVEATAGGDEAVGGWGLAAHVMF